MPAALLAYFGHRMKGATKESDPVGAAQHRGEMAHLLC
jgi:hypothetical protein